MKAMLLSKTAPMVEKRDPLKPAEIPVPKPRKNEILVRVSACGVCHTELDEIEGRARPPNLPVVPGHEIVGYVEKNGRGSHRFGVGERVGIGWIYSACGKCSFCRSGRENLCKGFVATGRDANGGYAEFMTVPEDFAYRIPDTFSDTEAAPLLCAGSVGYRSLRLSGIMNGQVLGLTGFGACGHLVLQAARAEYPNLIIYVFARGREQRNLALDFGADWAGPPGSTPPREPDCIIDTTPAWKPPVEALKILKRGGRLIINAIRKEDSDKKHLMRIDYQRHLWLEKEIKSVANVTRTDIEEFLAVAARVPIKPVVHEYSLKDANIVLHKLKAGHIRGALVLRM